MTGDAESALRDIARDVAACRRCPRLVAYREEVARTRKRAFADETYWGRGVPGYGDPRGKLLIVGLAPAAHGSNRTGRMFTGDGLRGSSTFLASALHATGYATLPTSEDPADGQSLPGAFMTAIARCAPPANRPTAAEITACAPFLEREIDALAELRTILCLGQLAWNQVLRVLGARGAPISRPRPRFGHGVRFVAGEAWPHVVASYHPSRQNTQTGRLTQEMLRDVLRTAVG